MPLFEYICLKCNHKFEELVMSSDESVNCPKCGTDLVTKQVSTFASSSLAKGSDCNPTSCGKSSFG